MGTYKVKEARANFKQLLDEAKAGENVTILRNFEAYTLMPVKKASTVKAVLDRLGSAEKTILDIDYRLRDVETKTVKSQDWGA